MIIKYGSATEGLYYFNLEDLCAAIENTSTIQLEYDPRPYQLPIPMANNQQEITDFILLSLREKGIEITELKSIELSLAIAGEASSMPIQAFIQLIQASSQQVNVFHSPGADAFSVLHGMNTSRQEAKTVDLSNEAQVRDCPLEELKAQALQEKYTPTQMQDLIQLRTQLKNRKSALECSQLKQKQLKEITAQNTTLLAQYAISQKNFAELQQKYATLSEKHNVLSEKYNALLQTEHNELGRRPNPTGLHQPSRFFPYARPKPNAVDTDAPPTPFSSGIIN